MLYKIKSEKEVFAEFEFNETDDLPNHTRLIKALAEAAKLYNLHQQIKSAPDYERPVFGKAA